MCPASEGEQGEEHVITSTAQEMPVPENWSIPKPLPQRSHEIRQLMRTGNCQENNKHMTVTRLTLRK